jgi:hypothetical protein
MPTSRNINVEKRTSAERALAIVDRFGEVEGNTIHAPDLNQELHPLRDLTLGVRCGRCRDWIAWSALDLNAAFVAAFQRRRAPKDRRGGIEDCYDPEPGAPTRKNWPWITLAETGQTSVTLEDIHTPGYPLRLKFTCRTCDAQYLNKNTRRLRLFLEAVEHGEDKITLT